MKLNTFLALTFALTAPAVASAPDWPQWRGPKQDGISPEKGLLKEWPSDGPPLAWRTKGIGSGMSSVSIANGRIYTLASATVTEPKGSMSPRST